MTISSETAKVQYSGDGSTTSFPTTFRFLVNGDVKVVLRDSSDVETTWVENTNYTLTGADASAGGTVVATTAPASGETLTIKRDVALTQTTNYVENDPFPADTHEDALDKLTTQIQQINEKLDRAVLFTETTTESGVEMKDLTASKGLVVNSAGDGIEMTTNDLADIVADATTQATAAAASATTAAASATAAATSASSASTAQTNAAASATSAGQFAQVADGAGTADVITADFTPDITLNDKVTCYVIATAANATTTPTFNPDALGAKTIVKHGNQALVAGDIPRAGYVMHLQRDTTNDVWELLNPVATVSGGLTWVSKTANYTASAGDGIMASTTGGAWTLTLPASPSIGDEVGVIDQDGTFNTNNLTVARNGNNIMGLAENMTVSTNNAAFSYFYSGDATDGWRMK